jgi:aryl sulfotransferase
MTLPSQTTTYSGQITDTNRWENFKHRPDDIFICTPPKCGTTWTQAITAMLVFEKADHGQQPGVISPWIDANFAPIEEYLGMVDSQTHRRFIKTHTPFDGIPYFEECQYLVVCRDPKDMFFSLLNHQDNMSDEELASALIARSDKTFEDWVSGSLIPEMFDTQTLETPTHFLKTYWEHRDLPNVHLFHYYDMKQDLRGHIANLANILKISLSDVQIDEMTEAATFESMQAKGDQFAPGSGTGMWKKDAAFFATGKNAQWKEKLTAEQVRLFDKRIGELLTPEQIKWLIRS